MLEVLEPEGERKEGRQSSEESSQKKEFRFCSGGKKKKEDEGKRREKIVSGGKEGTCSWFTKKENGVRIEKQLSKGSPAAPGRGKKEGISYLEREKGNGVPSSERKEAIFARKKKGGRESDGIYQALVRGRGKEDVADLFLNKKKEKERRFLGKKKKEDVIRIGGLKEEKNGLAQKERKC